MSTTEIFIGSADAVDAMLIRRDSGKNELCI